MLDSIYHMRLKLLKNHIFGVKVMILTSFTQRYNGRHYVTPLICKPLVVFYFIAWHYITPRHNITVS